jgi:hypothetical protein
MKATRFRFLLKALGIAITLLLAISQIASAQTPNTVPAYDAVKDFSIQSNPNGVWSYGYLTSWGAPLTLYGFGGNCMPGTSWWRISSCNDSPSVIHNDTSKPICWLTLCIPPNYLLLDPRSQLTVLRWTAPSSGSFLMEVTFVGLDHGYPTSTDVHVLLNSKRSLLKAPITSYQLPLKFYPKRLTVFAGDTIDFIVDWGKDQNFYGDSTGAEVKIWNLGQH